METKKDVKQLFGHLYQKIKKYPATMALVVSLIIVLLLIAGIEKKIMGTVVYLSVVATSFLLVEIIAFSFKFSLPPLPIKNWKSETIVIMLSIFIMALLSIIRFLIISDMQNVNPVAKIILLAFVILFIYPVFLLFYFLFLKKYTLKDLGLSWKYAWIGFVIVFVFGIASFFLLPEKMQFVSVIQENGLLSLIALGFLTAAIPEEFVRLLAQTRLAVLFSDKGLGWFITSLVWAFIHIPNFYNQSRDFKDAFISAFGILPVGLLWGYMTERIKSLVPSVIVHGTNLWGLQNIF